MTGPVDRHHYRVRYPAPTDPGEPVEIRTTVHLAAQTITVEIPGHQPADVDVVAARALSMLLWHAVFGSLHPTGPYLEVEKDTGGGWQPAGAGRGAQAGG